jgi:hypothetical protein
VLQADNDPSEVDMFEAKAVKYMPFITHEVRFPEAKFGSEGGASSTFDLNMNIAHNDRDLNIASTDQQIPHCIAYRRIQSGCRIIHCSI